MGPEHRDDKLCTIMVGVLRFVPWFRDTNVIEIVRLPNIDSHRDLAGSKSLAMLEFGLDHRNWARLPAAGV